MVTAERIKAIRVQSGMTQEELAKRLQVTRSNVNAWEHGHAVPSTKMLVELAKLFGVSTDYLLGIGEEKEFLNIASLRSNEKKVLIHMYQCFQELNRSNEMEH